MSLRNEVYACLGIYVAGEKAVARRRLLTIIDSELKASRFRGVNFLLATFPWTTVPLELRVTVFMTCIPARKHLPAFCGALRESKVGRLKGFPAHICPTSR